MDVSRVEGVILAGGLGTRLRDVVFDRPKPLAVVNGRPFLSYLLDALAAAGLRKVTLCVAYLGELIERELGPRHGDMELLYAHESQPLGTGGAVRGALAGVASETVLVTNGDSYCQADLGDFLRFHRERGGAVSLLLTHVPDAARFGRVTCDAAGRVLEFAEKESGGGAGWINAGMYLMERRMLESLPEGVPLSLERDVFPRLVAEGNSRGAGGASAGGAAVGGARVWGFRGGGKFIDIGTPESYREAEAFFGGGA